MERKATITITNLDDLFCAMKAGDTNTMDGDEFSADLPTFGGDEPADTREVWSWDATRMIVGTCADDLAIVSR